MYDFNLRGLSKTFVYINIDFLDVKIDKSFCKDFSKPQKHLYFLQICDYDHNLLDVINE